MRKLASLVAGVVVLVAGTLFSPSTATAAVLVQPGTSITNGNSFCTLNWIYDGTGSQAGKVFGGTAAHCFDPGNRVSVAGGSLGEPLGEFGTVVFEGPNLDYALIQIDAGCDCIVNAAMAGHPGIPTGVSTTSTAAVGDVVQYSGHGIGFDVTTQTQQQRIGVLGYNDGTQHYSYGTVSPGDSGGPIADVSDGNKALGVVDTVGIALTPAPQAGEGGVSLEGLLADAAARGFPVQLRTV